MRDFLLVQDGQAADFLIEQESFAGVLQIGETVAEDVFLVSGKRPERKALWGDCTAGRVVLMATLFHSELLERLERSGVLSLQGLRGKREVFLMQTITELPEGFPGNKELLVIAGSDKRGTIYGMFHLSELCGVSPLIYFGDVYPEKKTELMLTLPDTFLSKEPSVRYRGFFINDEWPAFGNWCTEKFGGINEKAYRKIFELLLRLKGNYLWPAMWRSSFSEDGPGLCNAKLADSLGVIMGLSHHEPMCRAGAEWQNQYQNYGTDNAWNFLTNAAAITQFWEDGLTRNLPYENVITIGMRGENDSKLMSPDATLSDNIEVIRKVIRTQHELIKKHTQHNENRPPEMLAIYKEVEDYFQGDETCEGLKDWEELKDVIFLLSDDNYGHLRALPSEQERSHPGGYGMYYHFDYHGAPVSYEWTNCNRLTKTWEQMTQAYEAGVKTMWIVNVGDIKEVEYPLCYFMELAYDFDTWGSSAPNKTEDFARKWTEKQFGSRLTDSQKEAFLRVLSGYTKWNAARSPEALRVDTYHPVHFREAERVCKEVRDIMETAEKLPRELFGEALLSYQSMVYYPAMASLNLVLMYLYAGQNKELAKRGCLYANVYAELVKKCIREDRRLVEEFHQWNGGKWNHCLSSAHTGFRGWDDKDYTYPTCETVSPIPGGKAVVSFSGSDLYHLGAHWQDQGPLCNSDFTRPDVTEVFVNLDSRGDVPYTYQVEIDSDWLSCTKAAGRNPLQEGGRVVLSFTADRSLFNGKTKALATIHISFDNGQTTYSKLCFLAENEQNDKKAEKEKKNDRYRFYEHQGYCTILAEHFCEKKDVEGNGFSAVLHLGREGSAIKAFPSMKSYENAKEAPYVRYAFVAEQTGDYQLDLYLLTRNPIKKGGRMKFAVSANQQEPKHVYAVSEHYYTEWFCKEWADGVLNHARVASTVLSIKQGRNDIYVYAGDPGVVLEKLVLYPQGQKLPESYFGPGESYCEKK